MRLLLKIIIEYDNIRKYNNYRFIMDDNVDVKDLLAQARAIHFAMRNGAITYEQAKLRVDPTLQVINNHLTDLAKHYKRKVRLITFQDLGRNF